jgi:pilus assembly protein CpaF
VRAPEAARVAGVVEAVRRDLLAATPPPGGRATAEGHLGDVDVEALVRRADPLLPAVLVAEALRAVRASTVGMGPLDALLADDEVSEVMVNGDGRIWVERSGHLEATGAVLGPDAVLGLLERATARLGVHADRRHPLVDARLPDGSRLHAVIPPLAVDGPCLTIRRFRVRPVDLDELCGPEVLTLLRQAVAERRNVLVSGGTSAGKTTLLNALAGLLPSSARVVTIEDTAELALPGDHVVRLEARPASADGVGEVPVADLVRAALRMRPDRIVVGEVRGGEALAMLQAMNTGHEGSMSTCHANSPADALRRIETMVVAATAAVPLAAVREQVRAALDLVVQVARTSGAERRVVAVDEVESDGPLDRSPRTRPLLVGTRVVDRPRRPPRAGVPAPHAPHASEVPSSVAAGGAW